MGNVGMPKEVEEVYEPLWQQVCTLHSSWGMFCKLYTKEETVRFLNKMAGGFFGMLQRILINEVLLSVSRLTNPPQSRVKKEEKDNLTLSLLVQRIDQTQYPKLNAELEQQLKMVGAACEFTRPHRNKRIAHFDLETLLNAPATNLPIANKQKIDLAIKEISALINCVQNHFSGYKTVFELLTLGDGTQLLINRLSQAHDFCKLQEKEWEEIDKLVKRTQ